MSKGHTSIRYIEKVALAWADNRITTVEQAKLTAGLHSQLYFSVMKALGINGRSLVPAETAYIDKWRSEYGFSSEVITAACERTIQAIHQPKFEYIDSILTSWKKNHVSTLEDIARLDEVHQKKKKAAVANTAPAAQPKNLSLIHIFIRPSNVVIMVHSFSSAIIFRALIRSDVRTFPRISD